MHGHRSSPKTWQDHLANIVREISYTRFTSEPNAHQHPEYLRTTCHRRDRIKNVIANSWWKYHATHNFMLEKKNHQQRKSFRHQPWWWVRGQHLPPNEGQEMESCYDNRSNDRKTNIEDEQLLNQQERQLFRVGTHQARHQLRNKRNLKRDEVFSQSALDCVCAAKVLSLCSKTYFDQVVVRK